MAVRLENYLFRSDAGTYKEILEFIENGHVRVNGEIQRDNNFKVDATENMCIFWPISRKDTAAKQMTENIRL